MSSPFLAWSPTVSDFQNPRRLLSSVQFYHIDYSWIPPTGFCGFRRIEIPQAYSMPGRVGILFRKVQRTVRVPIGLSPVLLVGMKSRIVVVGGSLQDASCPESLAEEIFGVSLLHRTC